MDLQHQIKIFKIISILEGLSFLILLLIAMPLKYIYHMDIYVRVVGMAHGVLFITYILGALLLFKQLNWKLKTLSIIILCSVIPLGPFYIEKKYL
ncbi:integral membrane protein [Gillisia sp. Hel1_33_143]|uniref:DUF3817 domain-containing protein n=1 Tax=unclassified Gillisia TaxID=2615025 RepID=UPI000557A7AA|nr:MULTISPECIES: DUF3817 domain-containing protein [unclassified Gillisia]SDS53042.1 integral membrane protein [Gillisia sp. Hel1_33_143]